MVICSMSGPVGGTNLLGYVQTSQSIGGVWHYSVALSPVTSLRSNWVLVENMNPSQLIPFGMSDAVPGWTLESTARLANANFRYKPVPPVAQNHIATTTTGNTSSTSKMPLRTVIPAIRNQQPSTPRTKTPEKETAKALALATKEAQKPDPPVSLQIRKLHFKMCSQGRRETACILCKGGSVCVHNKQRYWCKLCGGKAWCEHGKQKSRCVQCGGTGICHHGKLRARCKDCMKAMPAK